MDKKEYWKRLYEMQRAVSLEELSNLQGLQAVPKEELERRQLEAVKRGDCNNLYPMQDGPVHIPPVPAPPVPVPEGKS